MAATGLLGINPYFKGVNIDTSKPINLAIQLQQKEQAKAEALEKYFMDYEKSINPKGLGRGEGDVFAKKYNEIRQYWMKNREAILHPTKYGYDAQSTYTAGLKDALGYIEQAKQATAERKAFVDYINKQKASGKHISDNYLDIMNNAMKPVEAGYVAPDFTQIKIYDPHDPVKFGQKLDTLLKRTEGVPTKEFLPGSKTEYQWVTPKSINKDEAKALAYSELQDDGYKEYLLNIQKDPVFSASLAKVYQDNTGQKLDIKNLGELSYANVLAQAPVIKDRTNPELTEGYKTSLAIARQNRPSTELVDQADIFDLVGSGLAKNEFLGIYKTGQNKPYVKIKEGFASDVSDNPFSGQVTISAQEFPSQFKDVLKAGGKSQDVLDASKDYNVTFENGRIVNVRNKYIGNVDRTQLKNYQLAWNKEPQKGAQPGYGGRTPNPVEAPKDAKLTATGPNGVKIYSKDGVNWFDKAGKKIQ